MESYQAGLTERASLAHIAWLYQVGTLKTKLAAQTVSGLVHVFGAAERAVDAHTQYNDQNKQNLKQR